MTNPEQKDFPSSHADLEINMNKKRPQNSIGNFTAAPKKSTRKPIQLKERAHATFIEHKAQCGYAEKTNEEFVLYLVQMEEQRRLGGDRAAPSSKQDGSSSASKEMGDANAELVAHWKSRCDMLAERLSYVEQLLARTEVIASNTWKQKLRMEEEWKMCQNALQEMAFRETDFRNKLRDMEKRLKAAIELDPDMASLTSSSGFGFTSSSNLPTPNSSSPSYATLDFSDFDRSGLRTMVHRSGVNVGSDLFSPSQAPTLSIHPVEFSRNVTPLAINSIDGVLKLEPKHDREDPFFGRNPHNHNLANDTCFAEYEEPTAKRMKFHHPLLHSDNSNNNCNKHDDMEAFFNSVSLVLDDF